MCMCICACVVCSIYMCMCRVLLHCCVCACCMFTLHVLCLCMCMYTSCMCACAAALLCLCMLHVHMCFHIIANSDNLMIKTNHHCVTKEEGTLKQNNKSADRNISKSIVTAMSNLKKSKLIKLLHPIASPLPINKTASSSNCLITLPSPHGLLQEVAQPLCMQSNLLAYCYWGGWSKWPRAGHLFPPI